MTGHFSSATATLKKSFASLLKAAHDDIGYLYVNFNNFAPFLSGKSSLANDTCPWRNLKKKNYQVYIIGWLEFGVKIFKIFESRRSLWTDSETANQHTDKAHWNRFTKNFIFYKVSFTTPKNLPHRILLHSSVVMDSINWNHYTSDMSSSKWCMI